ncbi:YheC/YheD family protein [Paenibacillus nanensis]|uniref:YheC/YheD family protein n=1 Tax=Paenibacillus nanensis TaxID=393251 RepID=A0A3A1UPY8_9BACL|nr:YheC/YheD family protein [Paenibacillus nanensis]RIX46341.1 YheC/YheD family protein [Paenibacillus nanensis]
MKKLAPLSFGILTAPTALDANSPAVPPEPRLCRALSLAAAEQAVDVFTFSAEDYNPRTGALHGYRYTPEGWIRQRVSLPDVVYDRSFCRSRECSTRSIAALQQMRKRHSHQLINSRLPGKLGVYHTLQEDGRLAPYLPRTTKYAAEALEPLLSGSREGIVLKPSSGMQGRGLLHIRRELWGNKLYVNGRSRGNRPFMKSFTEISELSVWLDRFTNGSVFLVQPYYAFRDADNRPYDIRVLTQKDDTGMWRLTGMAVRSGSQETLTSNLHGGGIALPVRGFLLSNFGQSMAERLYRKIHTITGQTAKCLEGGFGRLGELGMDFGVEPSGKLWLIEVNTKPGREAFRQIGDAAALKQSIERPLRYARFLTERVRPTFVSANQAYGHPKRQIAIPQR